MIGRRVPEDPPVEEGWVESVEDVPVEAYDGSLDGDDSLPPEDRE